MFGEMLGSGLKAKFLGNAFKNEGQLWADFCEIKERIMENSCLKAQQVGSDDLVILSFSAEHKGPKCAFEF